jgi:hypothetical protein
VEVRLQAAPVASDRQVEITFPSADSSADSSADPAADTALVDGAAGTLKRIRAAVDVLEGLWPTEWAPESLVALGQAGWRIQLDPTSAVRELTALRYALPAEIDKVRGLSGDPALVARALALLGG